MPIKVACKCGQNFSAHDQLAGKKAKCPKCGSTLVIPSGRPASAAAPATTAKAAVPAAKGTFDELLDEVGIAASPSGKRCVRCNAPLPADGILCVQCGYNHTTGEVLAAAGQVLLPADLESHGNPTLDKAEVELRKAAKDSKKTDDTIPWWIYLIALFALGAFVVASVLGQVSSLQMAIYMVLFVVSVMISAAVVGGTCATYNSFAGHPTAEDPRGVPTPDFGTALAVSFMYLITGGVVSPLAWLVMTSLFTFMLPTRFVRALLLTLIFQILTIIIGVAAGVGYLLVRFIFG